MSEIKIGDYVKDIGGTIFQVKSIHCEKDGDIYYGGDFLGTFKSMVKKHSEALIDLIEIKDFVNEKRVIAVDNRINDEGEKIILTENYDEWTDDGIITNKDIKSVLTKEMYALCCYEVGGENE